MFRLFDYFVSPISEKEMVKRRHSKRIGKYRKREGKGVNYFSLGNPKLKREKEELKRLKDEKDYSLFKNNKD